MKLLKADAQPWGSCVCAIHTTSTLRMCFKFSYPTQLTNSLHSFQVCSNKPPFGSSPMESSSFWVMGGGQPMPLGASCSCWAEGAVLGMPPLELPPLHPSAAPTRAGCPPQVPPSTSQPRALGQDGARTLQQEAGSQHPRHGLLPSPSPVSLGVFLFASYLLH